MFEIFPEDEETTPIPSEVWKLISMETVDESQTVDSISSSIDTTSNNKVLQPVSDIVTETNNVNIRNGLSTPSRKSPVTGISSVSHFGTGWEPKEKEPLKLPEIDPSGTLITQGLNSQRRPSSNCSVNTPVNMVRNSFSESRMDSANPSDSRLELLSLDGEIMSPHPPKERREGSGNKSRTVSSASQSKIV